MSYWNILAEATELLERGDLRAAEDAYHEARGLRDQSPGRVFWSETVGDAARRLWRGLSGHDVARDETRWRHDTECFLQDFRRASHASLERSRHVLSEPLTIGAPDRLALFRLAVHLTTASALSELTTVDSYPFGAGALDAALAIGEIPPDDVIPAEAPLSAEARLDLVRRGVQVLSVDELSTPTLNGRGEALAARLLSLLDPGGFVQEAHEEERCWYSALLTDRFLMRHTEAAALYATYLDVVAPRLERHEEARLRIGEILGNVTGAHLPVPRYAEARRTLDAGSMTSPVQEARRRAILAAMDRRIVSSVDAWSSLALAGDTWHFILWQDDQPRDLMTWRPDEDPAPLLRALSICNGRIIRHGEPCYILETCELHGFVQVFMEAELYPTIPDLSFWSKLAGLETTPPADHAGNRIIHPGLDPDRLAPDSGADRAMSCGQGWRRVRARILMADPALRLGIRELARRGDGPAATLAAFLPPDPETGAGWTATPLLDRANPQYPVSTVSSTPPLNLDPALFETSAAVIATGRPGAILDHWGCDRGRWRLVLDTADRLDDLAECLGRRGGRHTLIPPGASVHDRDAALAMLDDLLAESGDARSELLPLFHWCRITETHNGDLGDFRQLRPREVGTVPLYDEYLDRLDDLPRAPLRAGDPGWGGEYVERARRSEVIAGLATDLVVPDDLLRLAWGSDDQSPLAWIFCDSPSVHWQLLAAHRVDISALHGMLARLGDAHLSLVLGGGFLRRDLEAQLADWLAPFGRTTCLALTDQRLPHLRLAGAGAGPDAAVAVGTAAIGLMLRLRDLTTEGRRVHLLPGRDGPVKGFLAAFQRGEIVPAPHRNLVWEDSDRFWRRPAARARLRDACLFVTRLDSLDTEPTLAESNQPTHGWQRRDLALSLQNRRRRALCALEVCAFLSRGAAEVDIADPRWWRSFPLAETGEGAVFPVPPAEAARFVGDGRAEVFDLTSSSLEAPGSGRRWQPRRDKRDPDVTAAVAWMKVQGWIGDDLRGVPPGFLAPPTGELAPHWETGVRRLVVGDPGRTWWSALANIAVAREHGDLGAWLLVIAETPPPEAAALRDTVLSPGVCLARHGETNDIWHVVVWVRPDELTDPRLRRRLAAQPPLEVWATDLRDWLPSARATGYGHAPVLRFLLHEMRAPTTLHARNLPQSWAHYFRVLLADTEDAIYHEDAAHSLPIGLDLPPATVGRIVHPRLACPGCGVESGWHDWHDLCPDCGTSLERWLDPAARRQLEADLWRAKLAALRDREDLHRDRPLCVWVTTERVHRLTLLLGELHIPWRRQRDRYLTTQDADAPDWLICVHGDLTEPPSECHHALLEPPLNEADFQDFRRRVGGGVSLWFHPLELSCAAGGLAGAPGAHVASAHRRLMTRFASPPGLDPVWCWRGWLSPRLVEILTGMPVAEVRKTQGVSSWLEAVHDEQPSGDMDNEPATVTGPRLLCRDLSLMEAEYKLTRLHALLDSILPVMSASLSAGAVGHVQLDDLPLEVDPVELSWLDRFLLGVSLTLPDGSEIPGSGRGVDNLLYTSLGGVINGTQRRLGFLGMFEDVHANLHCQLDYLSGSFRTLFTPGEDGDAPGTAQLSEATNMILGDTSLETGILLGLWHVRGPGEPGEITAESGHRTSGDGSAVSTAAIALLRSLAREEAQWVSRLMEAWCTGFVAEVPAAAVKSCREFPVVPSIAHALVARDLEVAARNGGPELMVLKGQTGTGRFATIAQALSGAAREAVDVSDIRIFCADAATAARFNLAWRTCSRNLPSPRIRYGDDLPAGSTLAGGGVPHMPAAEVAVLLEAQAMRAADRFRLAQHYRLGVQIWTVEPVRATESWEHLFLASPDADSVRDLDEQKRQARRVHEEVSDMADQATGHRARSQASRQERGEVAARLTASLDDGITTLCEKQSEWGGLLWNAVAPVPADLDYLGRAAARLGWLPVYRWELDTMLLPGPLEFIVVAGDVGAAMSEDDQDDEARHAPSALALMPDEVQDDYLAWLEMASAGTAMTLGRLHDAMVRSNWSESFLSDTENRHRVQGLVNDFAEVALGDFLSRPLLEAWRRVVADLPGQPPVGRGSPVLMLTTPDEAESVTVGSLAYFCLGTEHPRRHYDILARATDRLLVLYKDRSPLTDDGD